MKIQHVHHIAVNTLSIDDTVAFYTQMLGFPVVASKDIDGGTLTYLAINENESMELFDLRGKCLHGVAPELQQGLRHIAFAVDDIFAWDEALKKKGATFAMPLTRMDNLGMYGLIILDPNGVQIELSQAF